MVKLLHFTDPHSKDDYIFSKFRYIGDVAKSEKVDAVLCGGDFLEDYDNGEMNMALHQCQQDLRSWISGADSFYINLHQNVNVLGGYEKLKGSKKRDLIMLAKMYDSCKPKIESVLKKNAKFVENSSIWIENSLKYTRKKLEKSNRLRCGVLDDIFGKMGCSVYAVRGNHDVDCFVNYDWKNLKFIDDVVDVKGLKIAGATNCYEIAGVEYDFKSIEGDIFHGGNVGEKSHEFDDVLNTAEQQLSEQEFQEFIRRQIAGTPVFQRLYGKQFDVLLAHKGPHDLAIKKKDKEVENYGSGAGLENVIAVAKPKTILAGHVHNPLVVNHKVSEDYSYQGLRGSPDEFFIDNFDDNTKQLLTYKRHSWPKQKKKAA